MRTVTILFAVSLSLASARAARADEGPIGASTYIEGVGYAVGGHGANRLRGVGVDWLSMMDDFWIVVGVQMLAPATEADRADFHAATLRWGFAFAETPAEGSGGVDPLMGIAEITFNILHADLGDRASNGLGAALRLGVYGLLPPKGVLYYRVVADATGGHLATEQKFFAILSGQASIGLLFSP